MTIFDKTCMMAIAGVLLLCFGTAGIASAEVITGTGTLIKKDAYGTQTEWGSGLNLPRAGRIARVMDGTYGFTLRDKSGARVADFLDPQMAVGTSLAAGQYVIEPYVCARHRHHHVEVTVEY